MTPSGLTKAQYNALVLLDRGYGVTATQLAATCGMSQQAMAKTVSHLVTAGYVRSLSSDHGGRARVLQLTSRGQQSLVVADVAVDALERRLRQALDPVSEELFFAALERIDAASHRFDI